MLKFEFDFSRGLIKVTNTLKVSNFILVLIEIPQHGVNEILVVPEGGFNFILKSTTIANDFDRAPFFFKF